VVCITYDERNEAKNENLYKEHIALNANFDNFNEQGLFVYNQYYKDVDSQYHLALMEQQYFLTLVTHNRGPLVINILEKEKGNIREKLKFSDENAAKKVLQATLKMTEDEIRTIKGQRHSPLTISTESYIYGKLNRKEPLIQATGFNANSFNELQNMLIDVLRKTKKDMYVDLEQEANEELVGLTKIVDSFLKSIMTSDEIKLFQDNPFVESYYGPIHYSRYLLYATERYSPLDLTAIEFPEAAAIYYYKAILHHDQLVDLINREMQKSEAQKGLFEVLAIHNKVQYEKLIIREYSVSTYIEKELKKIDLNLAADTSFVGYKISEYFNSETLKKLNKDPEKKKEDILKFKKKLKENGTIKNVNFIDDNKFEEVLQKKTNKANLITRPLKDIYLFRNKKELILYNVSDDALITLKESGNLDYIKINSKTSDQEILSLRTKLKLFHSKSCVIILPRKISISAEVIVTKNYDALFPEDMQTDTLKKLIKLNLTPKYSEEVDALFKENENKIKGQLVSELNSIPFFEITNHGFELNAPDKENIRNYLMEFTRGEEERRAALGSFEISHKSWLRSSWIFNPDIIYLPIEDHNLCEDPSNELHGIMINLKQKTVTPIPRDLKEQIKIFRTETFRESFAYGIDRRNLDEIQKKIFKHPEISKLPDNEFNRQYQWQHSEAIKSLLYNYLVGIATGNINPTDQQIESIKELVEPLELHRKTYCDYPLNEFSHILMLNHKDWLTIGQIPTYSFNEIKNGDLVTNHWHTMLDRNWDYSITSAEEKFWRSAAQKLARPLQFVSYIMTAGLMIIFPSALPGFIVGITTSLLTDICLDITIMISSDDDEEIDVLIEQVILKIALTVTGESLGVISSKVLTAYTNGTIKSAVRAASQDKLNAKKILSKITQVTDEKIGTLLKKNTKIQKQLSSSADDALEPVKKNFHDAEKALRFNQNAKQFVKNTVAITASGEIASAFSGYIDEAAAPIAGTGFFQLAKLLLFHILIKGAPAVASRAKANAAKLGWSNFDELKNSARERIKKDFGFTPEQQHKALEKFDLIHNDELRQSLIDEDLISQSSNGKIKNKFLTKAQIHNPEIIKEYEKLAAAHAKYLNLLNKSVSEYELGDVDQNALTNSQGNVNKAAANHANHIETDKEIAEHVDRATRNIFTKYLGVKDFLPPGALSKRELALIFYERHSIVGELADAKQKILEKTYPAFRPTKENIKDFAVLIKGKRVSERTPVLFITGHGSFLGNLSKDIFVGGITIKFLGPHQHKLSTTKLKPGELVTIPKNPTLYHELLYSDYDKLLGNKPGERAKIYGEIRKNGRAYNEDGDEVYFDREKITGSVHKNNIKDYYISSLPEQTHGKELFNAVWMNSVKESELDNIPYDVLTIRAGRDIRLNSIIKEMDENGELSQYDSIVLTACRNNCFDHDPPKYKIQYAPIAQDNEFKNIEADVRDSDLDLIRLHGFIISDYNNMVV